jgi:predicted acetyltransferase
MYTMNVTLEPANEAQHGELIRNLNQLYIYEFARFDPHFNVGADGRCHRSDLDDAWADAEHGHFYLIRVDGSIAGYAIVIPNREDDEGGLWNELDEFFVLAHYQKRGVGASAARQLFDLYPGNWELCVLETNLNALGFWRRMLAAYTDGHCTERPCPEKNVYLFAFRSGG